MTKPTRQAQRSADTQTRIIAAVQALMLRQGYAATTVDGICAEAGMTKGAFFHQYASKEAAVRAAIDAWAAMGMGLYAQALGDPTDDPLDRLDRLLDMMISFTTTREEPCLCMVGMMSQELALTNPEIRAVCAGHLAAWSAMIAELIAAAQQRHPPARPLDPERVGWFLNSIWQGSMLIAKTRGVPATIVDNLELVRDYVAGLFPTRRPRRKDHA